MRANLQTIGQYAQEVSRRAGAAVVPLTGATPSAEATPAPAAARDPFEVSPQLREGRKYGYSGLPNANVLEVQRRVQVRAVIRSGQHTLAQLFIDNKDTITVMDKELIDLGDLGTFLVHIERDGTVALYQPEHRRKARRWCCDEVTPFPADLAAVTDRPRAAPALALMPQHSPSLRRRREERPPPAIVVESNGVAGRHPC
jgi:hypothetical protein